MARGVPHGRYAKQDAMPEHPADNQLFFMAIEFLFNEIPEDYPY